MSRVLDSVYTASVRTMWDRGLFASYILLKGFCQSSVIHFLEPEKPQRTLFQLPEAYFTPGSPKHARKTKII